jgi:hypothetical protein
LCVFTARIRPELWAGPPLIRYSEILFDRIGLAAAPAAPEHGGRLRR